MVLQAVREDPAAGHPLFAEPPHRTHQEANGCALLLVGQDLDVGQSGGVIHRDVHLLAAGSRRATLLAISSDAMAHPLKTGQLLLLRRSLRLGVDMNHVPRLLPLVPLHRGFGFQIAWSCHPYE
jgi:hypothetical protein